MRVLFAIHAPRDPRTAVFMNASSRAAHMRAQGHTVDIVAPADLGLGRVGGLQPLLFGAWLAFKARLSSYDLVVFHSHAGWMFLACRRWFDPRRRVCAVTTFHGLEPLYHDAEERELGRRGRKYSLRFRLLHRFVLHWLLRLSCRRSDGLLCLNTAERAFLVDGQWADPGRVFIVGNGVERELLAPRAHTGRARRLLFVAQWLPRKGIRDLVDAFTSLAATDSRLELVCAGTGRSEATVRAEFSAHLHARIAVFPSVDRATLADLLRSADIFVFPSLFEGFSSALLEGMAAGLAIVTTRAGAAQDLLEHERDALLIPYADAAALAAAVLRLLDNAPLRRELGAAAHGCAKRYDWDSVNAAYASALVSVVDRHDRDAGVRHGRLTA